MSSASEIVAGVSGLVWFPLFWRFAIPLMHKQAGHDTRRFRLTYGVIVIGGIAASLALLVVGLYGVGAD